MIRLIYRSVLGCLLALSSTVAVAVDETYMGLQFAGLQLDRDEVDKTFEPSGLIGRLGASVNDVLFFEGRVGTGLSNDGQETQEGSVTVDINYLAGGYGLLRANVSQTVSPYLIAGATVIELDSPKEASLDGTETSFSYGVGFDARVSPALSFGIEYIRYVGGGGYDLDALAVGVTGRF